MRGFTNRDLKIVGIIAGAVIAAVLFLLVFWFGIVELGDFNDHSMMEWRLGAPIAGIGSAEDGPGVIIPQFEWYDDGRGRVGLRSANGETYYFMGNRPDAGVGSFCVTGFATKDPDYSVFGIRIGDDELEAKRELLNAGYSIDSGALDRCRAQRGKITVILEFGHGYVTQIEAHLKTTNLFG